MPTPAVGSIGVQSGMIVIFNGIVWVPLGNTPEEEEMAEFEVTHRSRNVNSKRLFQQLVDVVRETTNDFVFQRATALSRTYDFSQLVEYLDMYMGQLQEEKVVARYDVMGDMRNNREYDIRIGKIQVDVEFQQFNCINVTHITFFITRI